MFARRFYFVFVRSCLYVIIVFFSRKLHVWDQFPRSLHVQPYEDEGSGSTSREETRDSLKVTPEKKS